MRNSVLLGATNGNSLINLVPCLDQRRSQHRRCKWAAPRTKRARQDCRLQQKILMMGKEMPKYGEFQIGETRGICNFKICKPIRRCKQIPTLKNLHDTIRRTLAWWWRRRFQKPLGIHTLSHPTSSSTSSVVRNRAARHHLSQRRSLLLCSLQTRPKLSITIR